jgi:hypothetical protein
MTFGMSRQGVGVEAETWPAPPQADVQQAARIMSADEAEALFMSKLATCRLEEGKERQTQGQRLVAACTSTSPLYSY